MEPMNLGSPSNSGPSSPATTPNGSPFLPSFLLGEPTSPLPGSTSPKVKRSGNNEFQHYTSPKFLHNQSNSSFQASSMREPYYQSVEKTSGPPITGLFNSVSSPMPTVSKTRTPNENSSYSSNVTKQFHDVSRNSTTAYENADSTWVTVFGYPPAAAGFILSQLASCGNIINKQVPANGNWMHVQFGSRVEAKRALTCNGKIFGNSVMVGVVACRDTSIIERSQERSMTDTTGYSTPTSPRSPGGYGDKLRSSMTSPRFDDSFRNSMSEGRFDSPRTARPLATRHDNEMFTKGAAPQKSSGIVSKAVDYLLGW